MQTNTVPVRIVISHYILSMNSFSLSLLLTPLTSTHQPNFRFAFSTACENSLFGNLRSLHVQHIQKQIHKFPY